MSGRTQFWLGSVMLALAMGLMVGSVAFPRVAHSQEVTGVGRAGTYALVTGVEGTVAKSQTVYVVDDANQFLYIFEYKARGKEVEPRGYIDLQAVATNLIKKRMEKHDK